MSALMSTARDRATGSVLAWALGFAVFMRLVTLGLYPLSDTTEARYAEIARKMAELGDWVTQWYDYGVPFWAKPPLSTWLTAASFKLLGVNEFAARLPYFLAAVFVAWLVWDWVRERGAREAMLATTLLSGTALYFVAAGAVMTDMALLVGTMLAMRGFWSGLHGSETQRHRERWLLFIGLAIGLLAKGPIALVLAGLPIMAWTVTTGNLGSAWRALPWLRGSVLTLALAVPWYLIAEQHTPGFLNYFLIGEHWYRFTVPGWSGDRYGVAHAVPRGTIWLYALGACAPWTILLPFAAIGRRRAAPACAPIAGRSWWRYLLLWGLAPCVFFTVSSNIIWTYVLPGLPALSMLAAGWLERDPRRRGIDTLVAAALVFAVAAFTGMLVTQRVTGSFNSAKAVVAAYEARRSADDALLFVGRHRYSPAFYSRGKAEQLDDTAELAERLRSTDASNAGRGKVFVAVRDGQDRELPAELRGSLHFQGRFGTYELFILQH